MKTPYAVICREHGQQFLTATQYNAQLIEADQFWKCPVCYRKSEWDDENYEKTLT